MTANEKSKVNGIKLANPVSLGTLYFGFALALWSSGQLFREAVVGIAVFSSVISGAFFVSVFCKRFLDILSKRVVRPLLFISFIAFVSGFVMGWLQSLSQVSGTALDFVIYFGFAWVVVFLLVVIRDMKQTSKIQNRVFLFFRNYGPYIVMTVFVVLAVIRFVSHDFWSGGYAIAIAGLSLSVARGWLAVYGDLFE